MLLLNCKAVYIYGIRSRFYSQEDPSRFFGLGLQAVSSCSILVRYRDIPSQTKDVQIRPQKSALCWSG